MEQTELSKSLSVIYQPHPVAPLDGRVGMVAVTDGKTSVRRVLLAAGIDPYQPITVQLDGELLEIEQWDLICPNQGQMLNVHGTVQGGGGDSQVLMVVAMIAITVATYGASAGWFATAGGLFAAGSASAAALGAAISIAGTLVVGALFQPKPQSMPNAPPAVSPTYSLSGGSNRARPYEPMPAVLGEHRLFLDYGARPFTEYRGNDQYLYQIFNLGLGNISATDYKIGTTALSSYDDAELINADANGRLPNFPSNVDSTAGAALTETAGYVTRTTSIDTYQIGIDLETVIFFANNKGDLEARSVELEIEFKLASSATFVNPSALEIFGDNFTYSAGIITATGSSQKPNRATLYIKDLTPDTYDVRIRRLTADSEDSKLQSQTNWSTLRSYQLDDADYKGQNRIGLIIRATEQLNGAVQQLSATVTAQATYWNGTAFVTGVTSNPAHWFTHFARGVRNSDGKLMYGVGLADNQLDLAALAVWANFCSTEGLTFNGVIDTNLTAADILNSIGVTGFGSPTWASGKLGVVFDSRNASPVMTFGMSNIIRDSFEVAYISENLAEEIVIRFSDPTRDYEQNEVRTLAPNVVTPTRTSSIDLYGCTSETMAGKFANYVAAQQYYRRRRVTWQSDFEGFVCQRGDVVLVSHDLTQWGYSGRFVASNNNIITLDRAVPRQDQIEYLMLIRPDGTTTTYDVAASTDEESNTLIVVNDVFELQSGADLIDHRWTFSPLETPGKKLKILSVAPASDSRLQIVATDESTEFYNAWNGTFVAPPIDTVLPQQPVTVTNLTLTNRVAFTNGFLTNRVSVSWRVGGGTLYSQVQVYLNGSLLTESAQLRVPYFELDINAVGSLLVEVTPFGLTGAGLTQTATLSIAELDFPEPPETVTLEVGENGRNATFAWTPVLGVQSYVIEVFSGGSVRRTVNVGNTLSYVYTVADAIADGGAFRSYDLRVYSVNQTGQSLTFTAADFLNPQIGQLQNASVEPMPNSIWFKCDTPTEDDFAAIKVWVSQTQDFTVSDAVLSYEGSDTFVTISADAEGNPLESGVVYYVRAAGYDTFGDDNLTLTAELSATILSPAWGLLENDITTAMIESGLRDRIDLIDTTGANDMPQGLIEALRETNTAANVLDADVNTIGEKLLESALKVQENTDLLYDAGVTVDSTTGEVYIFAVRENENRLDSAEIRLDGAEANINLRATTTYVDNAIATAVIDPSQIAELEGLTARVTEAEIDIDGLDAAITLKADLLTVQDQEVRLSTAEVEINALESEIVLKASNTDLTSTTARVTTVEQELNALDVPSITQSVQDVRLLNSAQDQIAETQLRDILTGEAHFTELDFGIAKAETRLTAFVNEGLEAEAAQRLELSVLVGDNAAAINDESVARATADNALASQITTLQAETGDNQAAIQTETVARTNADSALASQITTLGVTVSGNTAAIQNEATARADADSAIATQITGLQAVTGANLAAIQAETVARTDADSALSSSITTLQSTVGDNTTSIQTTATTVDGIQGKYSVKIDNNGYVSGFGLISTANNAVPFADFQMIADRFAIAPVATDPDTDSGSPFFVITAPQTINGVTVAAGTYMKQAFIYDAVITTAKINDLAVNNAKIADASINTAKIEDATITSAKIGDAEITTAKIADAAITTAKIGDAEITAAKILDATITGAKIGSAQIGTANIGDLAVTAAKIDDVTITAAKIADATITAAKITDATITAAKIGNAQITNAKIANGAISSAKIGDAEITTAKIGVAQIDTLRVAGNAITSQGSVSRATSGTSSFTINSSTGGTILIICNARASSAANNSVNVSVNGGLQLTVSGNQVLVGAESFEYVSATAMALVNVGAGTHTITGSQAIGTTNGFVLTGLLTQR